MLEFLSFELFIDATFLIGSLAMALTIVAVLRRRTSLSIQYNTIQYNTLSKNTPTWCLLSAIFYGCSIVLFYYFDPQRLFELSFTSIFFLSVAGLFCVVQLVLLASEEAKRGNTNRVIFEAFALAAIVGIGLVYSLSPQLMMCGCFPREACGCF